MSETTIAICLTILPITTYLIGYFIGRADQRTRDQYDETCVYEMAKAFRKLKAINRQLERKAENKN